LTHISIVESKIESIQAATLLGTPYVCTNTPAPRSLFLCVHLNSLPRTDLKYFSSLLPTL